MLHVMAQGGRIVLERNEQGNIVEAICLTRDGWALTGFTVELSKNSNGGATSHPATQDPTASPIAVSRPCGAKSTTGRLWGAGSSAPAHR